MNRVETQYRNDVPGKTVEIRERVVVVLSIRRLEEDDDATH